MDEIDKNIFETLADPKEFFPELGPQNDWFEEMYVDKLYEKWKSVGGEERILTDIYLYATSKDFTEENVIRLIKKYIEIRKSKYKEPIPPMKPFVLKKMKEIIDKRVSNQEDFKRIMDKNIKRGGKKNKTKKSKKNRKKRKSRK